MGVLTGGLGEAETVAVRRERRHGECFRARADDWLAAESSRSDRGRFSVVRGRVLAPRMVFWGVLGGRRSAFGLSGDGGRRVRPRGLKTGRDWDAGVGRRG